MREHLQSFLDEIGDYAPGAPHSFLLLHTVYYRNRNYFSALDIELLKQYNPTVVITLIDDFYDVYAEIRNREQEVRAGSQITPEEALQWRNVEIMMADFLANQLPSAQQHFVVAKKHPSKMLYRLLFERDRLRLYSAYPMRSTRTTPERLQELNDYRRRLNEEFTVFDPATIDERPLMEVENVDDSGFMIADKEGQALLKRLSTSFSAVDPEDFEGFPEGISIQKFLNLGETIDEAIERRDYRLINQADAMIGYRPKWGGGSISTGVSNEANHARRQNKPAYVVHKEDDGDFPAGPFSLAAEPLESLDELVQTLGAWQDEEVADRNPTWEA